MYIIAVTGLFYWPTFTEFVVYSLLAKWILLGTNFCPVAAHSIHIHSTIGATASPGTRTGLVAWVSALPVARIELPISSTITESSRETITIDPLEPIDAQTLLLANIRAGLSWTGLRAFRANNPFVVVVVASTRIEGFGLAQGAAAAEQEDRHHG